MGKTKENTVRDIDNKQNFLDNLSEVNVVRNYRDTVFRMLFKEKKQLLELYNAINDTQYTDEDALEVTTLENAIYMTMKNDVSCMLDMRLQLYEHQSTVNPNLPLRDLMYVTAQYEKYVIGKDLYSSRRIQLPTPKFIVFYNGQKQQPEREEFRLSDSFEHKEEQPSLELVVIQININEGYNEALMQKCPTLFQYMYYVNTIRKNLEQQMSIEEAVALAVEECIREDVLKEFLLNNKAGVLKMSIYEYDEELHKKTLYEDGYDTGYGSGYGSGEQAGEVKQKLFICRNMKQKNMPIELIVELTGMTEEEVKQA